MNPASVLKHIWIMFVLVTCANGLVWRFRARAHIRAQPELAEGYGTLIRGLLFWGNAPWVVMGLGLEIGGVPNILHYFRPRDGNPWVLSFFVSAVVVWALSIQWIFFRGGAEMLLRYPGLFNQPITSPTAVKVCCLAALAGGIVGLLLMFLWDVPVPF